MKLKLIGVEKQRKKGRARKKLNRRWGGGGGGNRKTETQKGDKERIKWKKLTYKGNKIWFTIMIFFRV
jgi:hypothetical protein